MDSLIFELQIVFYFQLFLSANVRHSWVTALQVVRTSFLGPRPCLFPPPPPLVLGLLEKDIANHSYAPNTPLTARVTETWKRGLDSHVSLMCLTLLTLMCRWRNNY